jgi:hypothetical protein
MINQIAVFIAGVTVHRLPSAPFKVEKDSEGKRIGFSPFVDLHPDIPWGRMIGFVWKVYSKAERDDLISKKIKRAEKNAKRAAKGLPPILAKVKLEEKAPEGWPGEENNPVLPRRSPAQTVKRGGKWVQVGSDNLTAHIVAK